MPKSVYFISDVHLGLGDRSGEKEKENRLLSFLDAIRSDCRELFILGDLFDFWFEYRTVIPKGFHRTLSAIQEYTDGGIPVRYLAGNHDFWMGDFFHAELGVDLHREPFEVQCDGKRIYLHHGDGLAERDTGYRMIKPVLRSRINIWLYRWLHPDLGVTLARGSSRSSRKYTGHKDYGESDGMVEFATKQIAGGADIVIMGHRHQPCLKKINGGTYVNLGDWIHTNTFAVLKDGVIQLDQWGGGEKKR